MSGLYQHQTDGAEWLAARPHGRGYLGDAPGLGKTRTMLRALQLKGAKRPLVICPAIVRTHWRAEAAVMGFGADAVTVKSYGEVTHGGIALMRRTLDGADSLLLDEHHLLKHAGSQRTRLVLGPNGYAPRLPIVFAASGTPLSKNPLEYWTTLASLFPHVAQEHGLRTAQDFKDRFCCIVPRYLHGRFSEKILATVKNANELREILAQTMLRRKEGSADVPEIFWQQVRLDGLGPIDGELIAVPSQGMSPAERQARDAETLELIAADPHVARMRRRLGELKVPPVVQWLRGDLDDSDEKVVVFAHHRSVLQALRDKLDQFGVAYIDGDTPQARRDEEILRFGHDADCRVFLGQNIACGTGTDGLQTSGARRVVLVEPDWTADVNLQLAKRIARLGQVSTHVYAQMVVLADTLDEAIVGQNLQEARMAGTLGLGEK